MQIRVYGILIAVLLLLPPPGRAEQVEQGRDASAELKQLQADYTKADETFFEPYTKAKTDAEREKIQLDYTKHPAKEFTAKFQALADRARGTEQGARALLWILQNGSQGQQTQAVKDALDTLTSDYIESPVMQETAEMLRYGYYQVGADPAQAALRKIAEKSPNKNARASALYSLASILTDDSRANPAGRAEARKIFATLKRNYGGTPASARATASIFELEHLQIGMTAPDFTATNDAGKPFKLSDYRGKVVVVDFWGFW